MLSHSSCSAMASCWRLIGGWHRLYTRFPSLSQRCSIGFKSGENAGQGRTCTPFWLKKSMVSLAEWARALSYWKSVTSPLLRKNGTTSGPKISSMYRRAVKLPSTTMSWVLWRHEIPPPHHYATTTPTWHLFNTTVLKSLPTSTPYFTPPIKHFNTKTGLVREQYTTPTLLCPSDTLSTPIKATDSTFRRQNVPLYVLWLEIPRSWRRSRTVKALTRRLWVPTIFWAVSTDVLNLSRKWLQNNVPVLLTCSNTFTSRALYIVHRPRSVVPFNQSSNRSVRTTHTLCNFGGMKAHLQPYRGHDGDRRYLDVPLACSYEMFCWLFNVKNTDLIMTVKKVPKISWLRKFAIFAFCTCTCTSWKSRSIRVKQTHASVTTLQHRIFIYQLKKSVIFTLN